MQRYPRNRRENTRHCLPLAFPRQDFSPLFGKKCFDDRATRTKDPEDDASTRERRESRNELSTIAIVPDGHPRTTFFPQCTTRHAFSAAFFPTIRTHAHLSARARAARAHVPHKDETDTILAENGQQVRRLAPEERDEGEGKRRGGGGEIASQVSRHCS